MTQDHYVTHEVRQVYGYGSSALALYLFDNRGNRTGVNRGNGTSTTFVPDAISRLGSMSFNGTSQDSTSTFAYNPASQIVTYTRSNDGYAWGGHFNRNDAYAVNGLNQITSAGGKSLGHDGRGNTTSVGTLTYSYTAENRMVSGPGGATL